MLKKFFIPHSENDYKPHVFREISVIVMLVLIGGIFLFCAIVIPQIDKSRLAAAIYSSVLVTDTNQDRANAAALAALRVNPLLVQAAQEKANDMAAKSYFAHNSPEGLTPWYWIKKVGYNYLYAGENLAVDFTDSQDVENAWMNSPDHRANILSTHFTEIGVATASGFLDGKQTTFVVQMFGSPQLVLSTPKATTTPQSIAISKSTGSTTTSTKPIIRPAPIPVSTMSIKKVEGEADVYSPEPTTLVTDSTYEANWFDRILVNPSHTLSLAYLIISIFIILALILFVFIERKVQHPKNIGYAIMLLIIMLILLSMHWIVSLSGAAII